MPGFGFTPFGRRAFSTMNDLPLPSAVAASAIAAGIVFTVEIFPVSGSTIRVATEEFATNDTDSLSNTPFSGTLSKALRYHRAIIDGAKIGGMSSGYSEIEINNPSGEYDAYANTLDGAHVIVKMGLRGGSFDSFTTLYDGLVDGTATVDEETMLLHLYDDNKRLEIPAQPNIYGGTGGIDGDSGVVGKRKPVSIGFPLNVSPPLIDAVNLIYQYHDGNGYTGANSLVAFDVRDRGISLTANSTPDYANYAALVAATVTPGRYASCAALGIFRLGAKPDGLVTCTAQGSVSNGLVAGSPIAGTGINDTASAVHYLLTISAANIVVDTGSVIATALAQPAVIGYWIGPDDNKTLRQAIDELMNGILGWAGFRRDRTFDMGLIALPTGTGLASYTGDGSGEDFFTLKQLPLPSGLSPPPWRIRASYQVNWTIQSDIDATVLAIAVTLLKDPYSIAVSTDAATSAAILAAHPQAQDIDVWPCFFNHAADAVAFANATLTLFGGAARGLYEVVVPADGYALNLDNPIQVTDNRYGLDAGKLLAIVSIDDDTSEEQATVQGFG